MLTIDYNVFMKFVIQAIIFSSKFDVLEFAEKINWLFRISSTVDGAMSGLDCFVDKKSVLSLIVWSGVLCPLKTIRHIKCKSQSVCICQYMEPTKNIFHHIETRFQNIIRPRNLSIRTIHICLVCARCPGLIFYIYHDDCFMFFITHIFVHLNVSKFCNRFGRSPIWFLIF